MRYGIIESDELVRKRCRCIDRLRFAQRHDVNPIGIRRAVEQYQIRLLVGGNRFGVRRPERRVLVRRCGEDYVDVLATNSLSKVLQWVVDRVDRNDPVIRCGARNRTAPGLDPSSPRNYTKLAPRAIGCVKPHTSTCLSP